MSKVIPGALLGGILFGAGLAVSGMTDPSRVIGFLDVFGESWDPTLAFVMGGAIAVFASSYWLLRGRIRLPVIESEPVSKPLLVGAVIFGVGWGLSGFCPGPALANLGRMTADAWVFVPMMALGMVVAQTMLARKG